MKIAKRIATIAAASALMVGCAKMPTGVTPTMATHAYAARESITVSLFPSDQAVLADDAVARILSSRLELPAQAKVALMKFPASVGYSRYNPYSWRDETQLKLQQAQTDTLIETLQASGRIGEVTPLPTLMTPSRISIPTLREAAVRMQADLLLVFRVGSDTYSQDRTFAKDKAKAYSTCELVLLDVRTGLVPFTRVISREQAELKQPTDLDLSETMRRAEQGAAVAALQAAASDLVAFVTSVAKSTAAGER